MTEEKSRGIGFNIPKIKRQISKDNVRNVNINSRDAQDVIDSIKRSYLDQSYSGSWKVKNVQMVVNKDLDQQYRSKRLSLKEGGRHARDLTEQFAFLVIKDGYIIPKIAQNGLITRASNFNALGDSKYGIHLCKHVDLQLRFADTWGVESCSVFIFKVTLGKCKVIIGDGNCEGKEPVPNFDCHVSHQPAKPSDSLYVQLSRSQIYLYEYNEDYETVERPRHCLPYAIVEYEKVEEAQTSSYGSKPLQRQTSHGYERSRPRGSENTGYGPRMSKTQHSANKTPVSKVPDIAQRNKNQAAQQQVPARRQSFDSWQTSARSDVKNSDTLNNNRSDIPSVITATDATVAQDYSSYSVKRSGVDPRLKRRSASSTADLSSVSVDVDYSLSTNTSGNSQTSMYQNYSVNPEPSVPTIRLGNMNLTLQTFAHTLAADLNPVTESNNEMRDKSAAVKSNFIVENSVANSNIMSMVKTEQTQKDVSTDNKTTLNIGFQDSYVNENKFSVGVQDLDVYESTCKGKEEDSDSSIQEVEMEDVSGIDLPNMESEETMFTIQVGENGSISSISAVPSQDHIASNSKQDEAGNYQENVNSKNIEVENKCNIIEGNNYKDFSKQRSTSYVNEHFLSNIPLPEDCYKNEKRFSEIPNVNSESGKKDSAISILEGEKRAYAENSGYNIIDPNIGSVKKEANLQIDYNMTDQKSNNQRQIVLPNQDTLNELDMYDPSMPTFSPEPEIEEDPFNQSNTPNPEDPVDTSKSPDVSEKDNSGTKGKLYTYDNKKPIDAPATLQDVDLRLERKFSPLDVDMRVEQSSCSSIDIQIESSQNIHTSQSLYSVNSNQSNSSADVQIPQNNSSSTKSESLSDLQTQHEITGQYVERGSVMDVDMRKFTRNNRMQDVDLRYSSMDTDLRSDSGVYSKYQTSSFSYSSGQQNYQNRGGNPYSQDNQYYNGQHTGTFTSYQRSDSQVNTLDSYVTSNSSGVIEEYKTSGSCYRQDTNLGEHYKQNNYPLKQESSYNYHQYPQSGISNQDSRYSSNQYNSEGYTYSSVDYSSQNQSKTTASNNTENQQTITYKQWKALQREGQDQGHSTQSGNQEKGEQLKMENVTQQVKIESDHSESDYMGSNDNSLPKDKTSKTPLTLADYKARRKSGTDMSPSNVNKNTPVMPNIQNILESVKNVDLSNLKNILQIVNVTKQSSDTVSTDNENNMTENKLSASAATESSLVRSRSNNDSDAGNSQTNIPLVYSNNDYLYQPDHDDNQHTADLPYSGRSTPVKDELPFYSGDSDNVGKSTEAVSSNIQNVCKNNVETTSKADGDDQDSESPSKEESQQNIKQELSEMDESGDTQTQKSAPSNDLSFLSIVKSEKGHGIVYTTNLIEEHGIPGFTSSSAYTFPEVKKEIVDSEMSSTINQSTGSAEGLAGSQSNKSGTDSSDGQGVIATVKSEDSLEESLKIGKAKKNLDYGGQENQSKIKQKQKNQTTEKHKAKNIDTAKDKLSVSNSDINVSDKKGTLSIKITNSYSLAHAKTPEKQETISSTNKSPLNRKHEESKPVVLTLRRDSFSDDENQDDTTNSKTDSNTSSGDSRRVVSAESPLMKSTPAKDTFVKPNDPTHSVYTSTPFDDSGSSLGLISCDGSYISEKGHFSYSKSSSHFNSSPDGLKDVRRVVLSSDESRNPVKSERDVEILRTSVSNSSSLQQEGGVQTKSEPQDFDSRDMSHSSSQSSTSSSGKKPKPKTKKVNKDMMGYRTRKRRRKRNKNTTKDSDAISNCSMEILSTTSSDIQDNHDDFDTSSNRSSDKQHYTPSVCDESSPVRTLADFGLSHWSEALKSGVFQPKIVLTDIKAKDSKQSDTCKDISSSDLNIQDSPSKIIHELPVPNADEDYPQQKQDMVKQWLQIARKKIKLTLKPKQSTKQATDECKIKTETKKCETQNQAIHEVDKKQITKECETQKAPAASSVKETQNQGMIPVLHRRVAAPRTRKIGPLCSKTEMVSERDSQEITDKAKHVESPHTKTILSVPSVSRTVSSDRSLGSNHLEPVLRTEQKQISQTSNIEPLNTNVSAENLTAMSEQPINRQTSQDSVKQIYSSLQTNTSFDQSSPKKVLTQMAAQPGWSGSNQHMVQEKPAQNQNQKVQAMQNQQVPNLNSSVPQVGQSVPVQSISNQQQPVLSIPAPPAPLVVSNVIPTLSTRPQPQNAGPNVDVNKQFSGAPLQIRSQNMTGPPIRFSLPVVPPLTIPPPRQISGPLINTGNVQRQNLVGPSINQGFPHQVPAMSASIPVPISQPVQILPVRQRMPPPPQVPNSPHNMMQNRPLIMQNAQPMFRPGNQSQPNILSADFLRGPPPHAHQQPIQFINNSNVSHLTSQPPPVLNNQQGNPRPVHQIPTTPPPYHRPLLSQPGPSTHPQTRPPPLSQPRPPFHQPPPPGVPQYAPPGHVNPPVQFNHPAQLGPSAPPSFPGNQIPSFINKQAQTPQRNVSTVQQFDTLQPSQNSQTLNQGVQRSNIVNMCSSTIPVITGRQTVTLPQVRDQTSVVLSSQTGTKRSKDPLDWFSDMITPKKRPTLDQNDSAQSWTNQHGGSTEPVIHSSPQSASSTLIQPYPSHPVQVPQSPITGNPQINQNIRPQSSADHFLGDSCQHMCAGPPSDADILDLQPSDESLFDSSLDEKSIDILSEKQLMIKKALNELEGCVSSGESDICKTSDNNNNDHEEKCSNKMEHSDLEDGEIDEDMDSENSEAFSHANHDSDTRKVQIKNTGSIRINVSFQNQEQFPWSKSIDGHVSDYTSQSDSEFVQENTSSPQELEKKKPFFSPVNFSSPYQNSHLINPATTKQNIKDIANSWSQMLMSKDNRIERVRGDNSDDQHKGTSKKQVRMRTEDIKTLGDFAIFETKDDNILSLQKYVSVDMATEISSLSKNRRKTMKKRLLSELENVKAKIAMGADCEIIDSTVSDMVMNVTDINDEGSHLTRCLLEEELRLIRGCISKTWKNDTKVNVSNGETETQLRQDLQTLENEIMTRINSLQIENVGSVNRRVPKGLLLESEYQEFFSEEGVFLILTCTVSKKIYKKLLKLKEDIRIINVVLPRYNSEEDSSKVIQLKQKRRDLQIQRRTLMMTFTGLLTKKRLTKIKNKLKFYNRLHSYLKEQYGEQFDTSFQYLNEVLSDLVKHDILAGNLLKIPNFVAEKSFFPKSTKD